MTGNKETSKNLPAKLLRWFGEYGRALPWRTGGRRDPYRVWLSEIMLQQTTVTAVIPYYEKFLKLYPDVGALAAAPREEVLRHWAGLGYYARARNLHKCAKQVVDDFGGHLPDNEKELRTLPGIGPYTAAAIAAIAFGEVASVVDGNVERVMARLFAVSAPLPGVKKKLHKLAATLTPEKRPGDYAEALMDLGAMVCTPKSPSCPACPWRRDCLGYKKGLQEDLPKRTQPPARPTRYGVVFWLQHGGKVLVRRRPDEGLLGGMLEFPSTPWGVETISPAEAEHFAPARTGWTPLGGEVRHTFTHFHLRLLVLKGNALVEGQWLPEKDLMEAGFPSVMKKVAGHVLEAKKGSGA